MGGWGYSHTASPSCNPKKRGNFSQFFRKVDCAFVCRTHPEREMEKFLNSVRRRTEKKQFSGENSLFLLMMAEPGLETEERFRIFFQSVLHQTKKRKMKNDGAPAMLLFPLALFSVLDTTNNYSLLGLSPSTVRSFFLCAGAFCVILFYYRIKIFHQ